MDKKSLAFLLALVSISLCDIKPAEALAIKQRLVGRPLQKASCDSGGCLYEKMAADKQGEFLLIITREGENYYWASREGKPLSPPMRSGPYDTFVSRDGAGLIRVSPLKSPHEVDTAKELAVNPVLADAAISGLSAGKGNCYYMEVLTILLRTVTYWGVCEEQ